jgi:hypothetical protein
MDNPRDILMGLKRLYGAARPLEKEHMEIAFSKPWNTADPIEELFDRLEECYVNSIINKLAYTMEQLIDKAIVAIQKTNLYKTALLEWEAFDEINKTWNELKAHFTEAYEVRLRSSGTSTASFHGYVINAEAEEDDSSVATIQESLNTIHIANHANFFDRSVYPPS